MFVPSELQKELIKLIEAGEYITDGTAAKDLGVTRHAILGNRKLLEAAGLIEPQSPYKLTRKGKTYVA